MPRIDLKQRLWDWMSFRAEINLLFTNKLCQSYIYQQIIKHRLQDIFPLANVSQFVNRTLNQWKHEGKLYQPPTRYGIYYLFQSRYHRPTFNLGKIKPLSKAEISNLKTLVTYLNHQPKFNQEQARRIETIKSAQIAGSTLTEANLQVRKKDKSDLEVIAYSKAKKALSLLNNLPLNEPLTSNDLKNLNTKLFQGLENSDVYQTRYTGCFKKEVNFVGHHLPCPPEQVSSEINNFLTFFNQKPQSFANAWPAVAFLHYWFESIHPFPDGNGRIGRLLINYYLKQHGILTHMNLTLSSYIETNKSSYFKFLSQANQHQAPHLFVNWFTKTALQSYSLDLIKKEEEKLLKQKRDPLKNHNFNFEPDLDFEQ